MEASPTAEVFADPCPACGTALREEIDVVGVDRALGVSGEFEVRICPNCGTGKSYPYVAEDDLAALYEGDYPHHTEWKPNLISRLIFNPAHAIYVKRLMSLMPLVATKNHTGRFLDVGCGSGWVSEQLNQRGWRAEGIEPTDAGCSQTRARGVEVHQGTINTLPELEAGAYDGVLFFHALEHVADPRQDLTRAVELMAPGGQLLIGIPNFGCWQRKAFGSDWLMLELPRHRTHFTEEGLRALVESLGLTVTRTSKGTSMSALPKTLQIKYSGKLRSSAGFAEKALIGLAMPFQPLTALYNRLRGGGEILNLVAEKPLQN
jgi:2-polyprenyl-3-methyl-5-hydroxy-6-metoxy-1,4-benzoquinol methylase